MSTKPTGGYASYTRHNAEYKQKHLKLASQWDLHESQLYAQRKPNLYSRIQNLSHQVGKWIR